MRRSIRKFNIPPPPPGLLNFLKLAFSDSPPPGQESRSNTPPISTEKPLRKDKSGLQSSTQHAFQRERCRNDTFNLLLKTLFKELFTNKGEIISCKSVIPCKNRKNSRAYYVRTREKFPTLPTQCSNSPLPVHDAQSNARGGGGWRFRFFRAFFFLARFSRRVQFFGRKFR